MRTADYDFDLPAERIAQMPNEPRDASRLMIVDRAAGDIRHARFADLATLIPAGDVLALNTTRVIRARLLGTRDSGAAAEILLLKPLPSTDARWEAMVHPGGKLKPGRMVHIAPGFDVRIDEVTPRRTRLVTLLADGETLAVIERHGHVPLPPYIRRPDSADDAERYQTVYARDAGSVAAPTAGLHFTPELLGRLLARGVQRADIVLHVGAGTFKPVETDDPALHRMHEEWYRITSDVADRINATRSPGGGGGATGAPGHLWAVGTTTARALESSAGTDHRVRAGEGETSIFIRPPYTWRAVDRLITNFHLPRSTLLMLVAAFAGYDLVREAYRVAVVEGYRFYSYGDAMLIL